MLMLIIYIVIFVSLLNIIVFPFLWVIQEHLLHFLWFTLIFRDHIKFLIFAKWFVSFINDCTRVTWVFPLKQKSKVSEVFPNFFQMMKNQFGVCSKKVIVQGAISIKLYHFFKKKILFIIHLVYILYNWMGSLIGKTDS